MGRKANYVDKLCLHCSKEFKVTENRGSKSSVKYCSNKCKADHTNTSIHTNCDQCNEPIQVEKARFKTNKHNYCSVECSRLFPKESKLATISCLNCNEPYSVNNYRKEKSKYCSLKCKQDHMTANATTSRKVTVEINCSECEEVVFKTLKQISLNKNGTFFCSLTCRKKYTINHSVSWETLTCLICNEEYRSQKSKAVSKFCSKECMSEWQIEGFRGENNPAFNSSTVPCGYCKTDHFVPLHKMNSEDQENYFCSVVCRQSWFREVYSQTEENKEFHRRITVQALQDGTVGKTDTGCQREVNKILDEYNVKYINDYNFKFYSLDNYLVDHNLIIEVMGTFWHTDPRNYSKVEYAMQRKIIKNDKAKNTYFINNHNLNILYIWETDVFKNLEICKKLIRQFVENKGSLVNYHSFNYIDENLELRENLIIPYLSYEKSELEKIIELKDTSSKTSLKQLDRWIAYNCDHCGTSKEQLKSKHKLSDNHFCSRKCGVDFYHVIKMAKRKLEKELSEVLIKKSLRSD